MRVAGYARVSTEDQATHGISLADQEHRIREFIASRGWECVEVFSDRGVSGSIPFARRPAGAQAFAAEVDRIVVVAWDRLGRDAADFLAVVRDRDVVSITEDGEPSLLRDLRAVLAQEERRKIAERTKAAARALARQGRYNGPRPLGYRFESGLLRVVPREAELVRRIFAEFVAGRTQSAIARDLNHDAIQTVRAGRWRQGSIRGLLANPLYVGELRTGAGLHEPILERQVFDRAQVQLEARGFHRSKGRGRPSKGAHLFTGGLLRCGCCGESMVPRTADEEFYLCAGRQALGCTMPRLDRQRIDASVYRYFEQVALDVEATRELVARAHGDKLTEVRHLRQEAEREAHRAAERLARILRFFQNGRITVEDWNDQREGLRSGLAGAEAEAKRLAASEVEVERDSARLDAEAETLRHLSEVRRAVVGEVRSAPSIEAARAALARTFERFILHRSVPSRVHVELIGEPWIEPVPRGDLRRTTLGKEGVDIRRQAVPRPPLSEAGPRLARALFEPILVGA